jgi:hypothetical protein
MRSKADTVLRFWESYAPVVKVKLAVYVVLLVFGGVCFSLGGQMRHRPEWQQDVAIAFWAAIAYVLVRALLPTAEEIRAEQRRGDVAERLRRPARVDGDQEESTPVAKG